MAQQLKVLHVEDDPTDALLMKEMLCDASNFTKYDLVHADSLVNALRQLEKSGFDVVLLDLGLKDVQGIDNIKAIQEQNPDIPVVVLSGLDNHSTALKAIDSGAQEYIIKGYGSGKVIQLAIQSSIQRKAVERRLFERAYYDDLTGLPNRRTFQEHVEQSIRRAERNSQHLSLLFVDMDNFKPINDRYGHEAGNRVLRQAALRFKKVMRKSDIIARYGGDEFVICLETSKRGSDTHLLIAQKLLDEFKKPFDLTSNVAGECTISIGISQWPNNALSYKKLIAVADHAMYQAKRAGGNRYSCATS